MSDEYRCSHCGFVGCQLEGEATGPYKVVDFKTDESVTRRSLLQRPDQGHAGDGRPKDRGQVIDWIAAVFGTIFPSSGVVEVWRDLLSPPCPRCRKREPPPNNAT